MRACVARAPSLNDPLRIPGARTIGELLEATFRTYRDHFLLFAGLMVPPEILLILVAVAARLTLPDVTAMPDLSAEALETLFLILRGIVSSLMLLLVSTVAYAGAWGAFVVAVTGTVEGRVPGIRQAYKSVWPRFAELVGLCLMLLGLFGAGFLLSAALALGVGLVLGMLLPLLGVLAILMVLVPGILVTGLLVLRYAVALPALTLEGVGILTALRRSVELTRGHVGRSLLLLVLMMLIGFVAGFLLEGPFLVAGFLLQEEGRVPLGIEIPAIIAGGVAGVLSGPFLMIAIVLLYFDLRARREGLNP